MAQGRMPANLASVTAGLSRSDNYTDLLVPGEMGGAGAGGGVTWLHVPPAGTWRVRLGSNTHPPPPPSSHIYRNPLRDQGLGTMGPLRGCDAVASHLTGCALIPMD